ncbi:hypothetical protein CDO52_21710 [Nocardiopsis gilva YIM 90087]|uniref:Fe2OG dioxygenase domain-containing protein n=2 Tax=Nocardiopsis gilva TaxID=280236 RepID=A0A223SAB1_9ACTN|nr:hypothetical protein CDO52_21710 [Nocardiopsis gilva YIM 90087]
MAALIDLDRYPIDRPDSGPGAALLKETRKTFEDTSLAVFDGFLQPEAVNRVVEETVSGVGERGFRFEGSNKVFLGTGESGAEGHTHTKATLAYDLIATDSPLKALYAWDPLLSFVSAVVGQPVYRSVDPVGAMTVHVHHGGDEQDWHFDVSEYTLVLHLLAPEEGGVLEYVPRSRSSVEQHEEALRGIVEGKHQHLTRELPTAPGALVLHSGRASLHRVTPVHGITPRISATLSYNSTPDGQLNEYTRQLYFGRER